MKARGGRKRGWVEEPEVEDVEDTPGPGVPLFGAYRPNDATIEMGAIDETALSGSPFAGTAPSRELTRRPTGWQPPPWQQPPPAPPTRQPLSSPGDGQRFQPAEDRMPPRPAAAPPATEPPGSPTTGTAPPPSRRSSFLVAAGILLSRVSGLIREMVMASFLGTSVAADAFRAALRIPNLLQNLLGEGVLSASFIPVYARLRSEGEEREAGRLAGAIAGLLLALTGFLSAVGLVLAGPITALITPGLGSDAHDLAVDLVRIMFPGIGFLVLSAWCLGVLNSHRRFFLSYVAPVLWNAAQIIALVTVGIQYSEDQRSLAVALSWGVLIGGFLQLAVQFGPVMRLLGRLRLSLDTSRASVRDVLRRFWPVLVSRGSVQILAFFDLMLASWLMLGAIAAMGYAHVLYLLPISLFGMSVAAAELPDLSEERVEDADARRRFRRRLEDGMARIGFYVAPTATMFIVAGDVIISVLFENGRFTQADTWQVWLVLATFSLGLPAVSSSRLLINGLFALGDPKTPARLAVIRVLLAAGIGVVLMFPLDRLYISGDGIAGWGDLLGGFGPFPQEVRDANTVPHLGLLGLAIGTSIAAWFEYLMLSRALAWRVGRTRFAGRWLNPIAAACAVAALVAAALAIVVPDGLPSLVRAVVVLGPPGLAYLGLARSLGVPEATALVDQAARLAGRTRP